MAETLTPEEIRRALGSIAAWRVDPGARVPCPRCGAPGLGVADQSARPYAEWYALSCVPCGLVHTLHVPMAPPGEGT